MLLEGKIAIVTGCNRGIGKSILDRFAENGAVVFAIARKKDSLLEYQNSTQIIPCYLDITDKNAVKELFLNVKKMAGKLDILVNNAGIMQDALLGMITDSQIQSTFEANVFAGILMMQYGVKLMKKSGSIINIASIIGLNGNAGQIVYSATKGAVIAMTKSAAKELAPDNIRVNAIAPGCIATDMLLGSNISGEKLNVLKSQIGMQRFGSPDDVAKAVLFLASDLSEYVSGQVLGVDGVMSTPMPFFHH